MHLDPDLHPDERDTKQQTDTIGRTNIDYGDPSTQKAPKGAIITISSVSSLMGAIMGT